jgi:hypothetical protein
MRWVQAKAEALLHLRCIELNGDWQKFVLWFQGKTQARLMNGERRKILTNQPLTLRTQGFQCASCIHKLLPQ